MRSLYKVGVAQRRARRRREGPEGSHPLREAFVRRTTDDAEAKERGRKQNECIFGEILKGRVASTESFPYRRMDKKDSNLGGTLTTSLSNFKRYKRTACGRKPEKETREGGVKDLKGGNFKEKFSPFLAM